MCREKGLEGLRVITAEVTAESLRRMDCPNERDESVEGQTLKVHQCSSVRGEREDRPREYRKEPSEMLSWEFKSF